MKSKNEKMREKLQRMTTAELQERLSLRWLSRDDADEEYFDLVEEVLLARSESKLSQPVSDGAATVETVMAKFKAEVDAGNAAALEAGHTAKTGTAGRKRRTQRPVARRIAAVAAVVAALALCLAVAQAACVDVFGTIGRWTESVFHFERTSETTDSYDVELMQVDESTILPELREAFAECEIPLSLAPKNVPEGFAVSDIAISDSSDVSTVTFVISDGNNVSCTFNTSKYKGDMTQSITYEKSDITPETYSHKGHLFYIIQNAEHTVAVWTDGEYEVLIAGEVEKTDIIQIISLAF